FLDCLPWSSLFGCDLAIRSGLDRGLNLFMHVELHVVVTAAVLTARAGAFPAAEGWEARPRARGGTLWTIGISDARFDVIEEPGCLFLGTVETRGEAIVDAIGDLHGFIQVIDFADGGDGQEHFILPQAMFERQVSNESGLTEIAFIEHTAGLYMSASEELAACTVDLFGKV